jgi:UDP-GlcNAc:undecaprenyl-phosphate GlcNAc-1-phosphate transferase
MLLNPIIIICILTISFIIHYYTQRIFLKNKLTDVINDRSSHSSAASRSGGVGVFITLFLVSLYYYLSGYEIYDFSIVIPLSILTLVGFYDDLYNVDFKLKFIFQIIVAKIIIDNGFIIDNLHGVFGLFEISRIFAQLLTIFIIVAIINAINFIDGIDGLAISVGLLFIISFEYFAKTKTGFSLLNIIIISSLVPLYYFNFRKKNKVFLGDSGSLLLGGIISIYVIFILSNNYVIKNDYDLHKIIYVISILSYPIVDIIRIFFLRIIQGRSPFIPDRNHIHHIILDKLKNHFYTTFLIFLSSVTLLIFLQLLF